MCHTAQEVDTAYKIINSDFYYIKFRRNESVQSLAVMINVPEEDEEKFPIYSTTHFQRMNITKQ